MLMPRPRRIRSIRTFAGQTVCLRGRYPEETVDQIVSPERVVDGSKFMGTGVQMLHDASDKLSRYSYHPDIVLQLCYIIRYP